MRHLDYNNLKHLVKTVNEIHLTDINLSNSSSYKSLKCESCRQTFVKWKLFDQILKAIREDEIIHVNLVYLIKFTDYDKFKDYIFITDDWNDFIAVYFIKNKFEAVKYLQKYCNCKKAHKISVLVICSDNEFVIKNRKFIIWKKNIKIEWRFTVFYHSEQNEMLKVNQHILHLCVMTLLQNAELLMFLWFLVMKHMTHFKNQSSQQKLRWKILIKMLTDKRSDLFYLQIWKFKVIYHIFKQKHVKFEKYKTCRKIDYLVEYENHTIKTVKIWLSDFKKIIIK